MSTPKPLPNDVIKDIPEYVFALAAHAVGIESLYKLQQSILKAQLLDVDETEQAITIAYEAKKLFHAIDALVHLMGPRAEINVSDVANKLKEKLNNESTHGKNH
jgi:hypothetical protein